MKDLEWEFEKECNRLRTELESTKADLAEKEESVRHYREQAIAATGIRAELEKAQACCAEMRPFINGLFKVMCGEVTLAGYDWPQIDKALSSTCGTALLKELRELREALSVAINTVECTSIDVKTGEELPWHKMATKALRRGEEGCK